MNRRQVLAGASALALMPRITMATAAVPTLEARPGKAAVVPGYPQTAIWGFDGGVPGPVIRVAQGAPMQRRLLNSLPQPTSVHWHGLRIANAMDGVPGLTQDAVAPGDAFSYDFTPPDAGTFWYHSHNQSTEQVARGLYGPLIVDEAEKPDVDHDIIVLLDDWRLTQEAQIVDDFGAAHDWTHAGRMGNFIGAKLLPDLQEVQQNQRLRLRLINTATDRIMVAGLQGLAGLIVALDGMPLLTPAPAEQMVLGPAQRADLVVDVTAAPGDSAAITLQERDATYVLAALSVTGSASRAPRAAITALPANPAPILRTADAARKVPLLMQGGAMGGLVSGIYQGRSLSTQELVQQGQIWTLNGIAGLPPEPLTIASTGESIRIPITNETVFPHAMHLHGHHFQEVLADNTLGPRRDTLLLDGNETREIVFTADNPGDWLLHCHMLSHQAAGMKTWLRVTA